MFIHHENADFNSFVAFDFETTGLSPNKNGIIEIGAVKVINGIITHKFSEIVKPMGNTYLSPVIVALTGITQKQVDRARSIADVLPEFIEFCENFILVGYNNFNFDNKFLQRVLDECKLNMNNEFFDALLLARKLKNSKDEKCSLADTCFKYKVVNEKAHGAYYDAKATAECYIKMCMVKSVCNVQP